MSSTAAAGAGFVAVGGEDVELRRRRGERSGGSLGSRECKEGFETCLETKAACQNPSTDWQWGSELLCAERTHERTLPGCEAPSHSSTPTNWGGKVRVEVTCQLLKQRMC